MLGDLIPFFWWAFCWWVGIRILFYLLMLMLGDLTSIVLVRFLLMFWDLRFKFQKFLGILNGFVNVWSVEFEILLISFVLLTYGGLTFKIFLLGVILSMHLGQPFIRSLAFFNSQGFDLLKLFLVFCGCVDMRGRQFTSFMIFVIVVMCEVNQ